MKSIAILTEAILSICISLTQAQQAFWEQMNVSPQAAVYAFVVTPKGVMFAGTENGGYKSIDTGKTWMQQNAGLPSGVQIGLLVSDSKGTIYAGVSTRQVQYGPVTYAGVYKLLPDSSVWQEINSGLTTLRITALGADQKHDIIFAGTANAGGFNLGDTDTTWHMMDSSLSNLHLDCFLVDTTNDHIFVGTDKGIFRSLNSGTTWSQLGNTTDFFVMTMAINSKGYIFAGSGPYGVFRSTNEGETWDEKNPMPMDSLATNILVNSRDVVFANTQGGIFSSSNDGDSWTSLAGSLSETTYLGLDANQYLYAGTATGIVYRTINPTVTRILDRWTSNVAGYSLANNFPNPFNPTTTISYQISQRGLVTLKVYDVLGREIVVLVNEEKTAGIYKIEYDGSNISSGIYFYKLQAGSFVQTKKMILLH